MTNYYIPLPAPRIPDNANLDFSGLNSGIDAYQRSKERNMMLEYRKARDLKADARADETLSMRRQEFNQGQGDHRAKVATGIMAKAAGGVTNAPPAPPTMGANSGITPNANSNYRGI